MSERGRKTPELEKQLRVLSDYGILHRLKEIRVDTDGATHLVLGPDLPKIAAAAHNQQDEGEETPDVGYLHSMDLPRRMNGRA